MQLSMRLSVQLHSPLVLVLALACALPGMALAAPASVPAGHDSLEQRIKACTACHAPKERHDAFFPRIAGKPAGYLYNQLVGFRDGTRSYPPMNYLVAYLPDAYLKEIAQHFASLRPAFQTPEQPSANAAMAERGRVLATVGDTAKGIPACMACHGKSLSGMEPGIPGLAGLRSTYIVGQLTRWRVGERRAADPDCMKRIATRLSDTDVTAVASWLAQQTPPANASPEPSNLVRMPVACGSQR